MDASETVRMKVHLHSFFDHIFGSMSFSAVRAFRPCDFWPFVVRSIKDSLVIFHFYYIQ